MERIRILDAKTYNWVMKIPLHKWTHSYDGGKRYGSMTTNTVESVNGMLKGFRGLPITAMVEKIFYQCAQYFDSRRTQLLEQQNSGHVFTQACRQILQDNAVAANGHRVKSFDTQNIICEIQTRSSRQKQVVKLLEGTCTCGKFQDMRIPCSHAIAACQYRSIDFNNFVDSYYTLDRCLKCYQFMFHPLGHPDYWPDAEALPLVPDQSRIRKKGRPTSMRIRNEMDWGDARMGSTSRIHCSVCGKGGHNKKTCAVRMRNG
jgi:hypothetical protein